jgi:ABC-type polysaccharide/polyol phosphate export permease
MVPRGKFFSSTMPNTATPLYSPNQLIHLIHEFRHPILLIKVPAADLADDHLIEYTQYMHFIPNVLNFLGYFVHSAQIYGLKETTIK